MARYSAFLGRRVEVHYRAGDILLPATGTFVADSGRSIFLEQNLVQREQVKRFRWEIPYQYIVRLEELPEAILDSGQDPNNALSDSKIREPEDPGDEHQSALTPDPSDRKPASTRLRNRARTA